MQYIYGDMHVHIGSAMGKAIKITASRDLNLEQLIFRDSPRKGLDMIGIVDAAAIPVAQEIGQMLLAGKLREHPQGGLLASNGVLLIPACEVESREGVHWVLYFSSFKSIQEYQKYVRTRVKNMNLSTQKTRIDARELVNLAVFLDALLCPAHAFTPHKGAYGAWVERLTPVLGSDMTQIKGLELGLSSDSHMAGMIEETRRFTFLSNSDAHSSANVGREYNLFRMQEKNFMEFRLCLENSSGRRIAANFGMDPLLGKYHRSYCLDCEQISGDPAPVFTCGNCGSTHMVPGVYDRIMQIKDYDEPHHPVARPPYQYRVPLKMLPGVGPKMVEMLITYFENEINVAENADLSDIERIGGDKTAALIANMRKGRLNIVPGGGGRYGKVKKDNHHQ